MMQPNLTQSAGRRLLILVGLLAGVLWSLMVNGAVPGVGTPTLGQAMSMMGYAQAFADQHWYAIHARSFGYPVPMSLATGLPLAWVAGWFLRFGFYAADAYAATIAFWLVVAFFGAWKLAMRLGLRAGLSILAAATWLSTPMVWAHQGYSSLALGMAMLPFYTWTAVLAGGVIGPTRRYQMSVAALFLATCSLALFMDGYTFMMFAVVAGLLWISRVAAASTRGSALRYTLPVYLVGFGGAYFIYTRFMGVSAFEPAPLDFFRGWGLDVLFLGKPPTGEFWLWDALGWHGVRNETLFYGDASVWNTSFILPLLLASGISVLVLGRRDRRVWPLLAIAVFGLYMAFGPTLKAGSTKPTATLNQNMPVSEGRIPTGNAFIYAHIPGFKSMRATYRWEALTFLGLWAIVALGAARSPRRGLWAATYIAIIAALLPHLGTQWGDYRTFRTAFKRIDSELAEPLSAQVSAGSRVFFMPWNNDVMANYLSPKLHVTSYNVGGDKQLKIASAAWPLSMASFSLNRFTVDDVPAARELLFSGDVDAIIVPYFNSLYAAHVWPCLAEAKGYSAGTLALFESRADFLCPAEIRAGFAPAMAALHADPMLAITETPLFAVIKLLPKGRGVNGRAHALALRVAGITLPVDVATQQDMADRIFGLGWHHREPLSRWSTGRATLSLPEPEACRLTGCVAQLTLAAFAANTARPVTLRISATGSTADATSPVRFVDDVPHVVNVPLPVGQDAVSLTLEVDGATSPAALGMSVDARVLGVSLTRINVIAR
ncbi:hypothetical protein L2Y96_04905 [Luteibacter aegosomaticola]|uniref:hypothetical protein n=1 Tax=Luteibacter aegosomaticola TaxID=2911538 RepID=UPI001FFA1E04|nr:hypothetical protein [Luteibacter aegosomaticola]UPG91122.1 hypothetical protein L2Y96_04905 [Luteibacter aegosomaticola]